MAEPVTLGLIAKKAAPLVISTVGGSIYNSLFPDKAKQIQLEVLEEQKQFRRMLNRQARGIFTSPEREAIARGAEPTVNRIAGGVAQRGLGGSGAGAQVIAQAQQAPFLQAQTAATQALSGANTAAFSMASQLVGDDSFYEDLGGLAQNLTELYAPTDDTPPSEMEPEVDGAIGLLREGLEALGESLGKVFGTGE